jgi:hypothetical protein
MLNRSGLVGITVGIVVYSIYVLLFGRFKPPDLSEAEYIPAM